MSRFYSESASRFVCCAMLTPWASLAYGSIPRFFVSSNRAFKGSGLVVQAFPRHISSPEAVYAASIAQLKQLVVNYRRHFASSTYTVLWHTALIYLVNQILSTPKDED